MSTVTVLLDLWKNTFGEWLWNHCNSLYYVYIPCEIGVHMISSLFYFRLCVWCQRQEEAEGVHWWCEPTSSWWVWCTEVQWGNSPGEVKNSNHGNRNHTFENTWSAPDNIKNLLLYSCFASFWMTRFCVNYRSHLRWKRWREWVLSLPCPCLSRPMSAAVSSRTGYWSV